MILSFKAQIVMTNSYRG